MTRFLPVMRRRSTTPDIGPSSSTARSVSSSRRTSSGGASPGWRDSSAFPSDCTISGPRRCRCGRAGFGCPMRGWTSPGNSSSRSFRTRPAVHRRPARRPSRGTSDRRARVARFDRLKLSRAAPDTRPRTGQLHATRRARDRHREGPPRRAGHRSLRRVGHLRPRGPSDKVRCGRVEVLEAVRPDPHIPNNPRRVSAFPFGGPSGLACVTWACGKLQSCVAGCRRRAA